MNRKKFLAEKKKRSYVDPTVARSGWKRRLTAIMTTRCECGRLFMRSPGAFECDVCRSVKREMIDENRKDFRIKKYKDVGLYA